MAVISSIQVPAGRHPMDIATQTDGTLFAIILCNFPVRRCCPDGLSPGYAVRPSVPGGAEAGCPGRLLKDMTPGTGGVFAVSGIVQDL